MLQTSTILGVKMLLVFLTLLMSGHHHNRQANAFTTAPRNEQQMMIKANVIITQSPAILPCRSARTKKTNESSKIRLSLFTQVISDVDDTLKSSGGVNVAGVALGGIDVQYPRGELYPGVAEFMLELSLSQQSLSAPLSSSAASSSSETSFSSSSAQPSVSPPKVAILTARAEEFKMALELKADSAVGRAFLGAGQALGLSGWGLGPVLYGSVAEWIVQDRKGLRKFSNFERLLQQDPTGTMLQYVYVGDTGELDQEAGETMLREYPEVVKAVFLHVVSGDEEIVKNADAIVPVPPPKLINGRFLVFFRTYVGAAVSAVQLGFMTVAGLKRVVDAACARLEQAGVPRGNNKWKDLERDIARAEALW